MLASEFVKQLEDKIKKHGDLEVRLDSEGLVLPVATDVEYCEGGTYSPVEPCFIII